MFIRTKQIWLAAALLGASACSTVPGTPPSVASDCESGRDFDPHVFEGRVKRGVSTQLQVDQWLGPPAAVGVSVEPGGLRLEQWVYHYARCRLSGEGATQYKQLEIKFDTQGVVRSYRWSAGRDPSGARR